jgi:chemotaxis protein MotB
MANEESKEQPIIIKKIKKGGHGHHGGAWKVAYADFVTAMMAFFIVMWIISASEETKESIEAYFDNPGAFSFITGKRTIPIDHGRKYSPGSVLGDNIGEGSGESSVKDREFSEGEFYQAKMQLKAAAIQDSIKQAERVRQAAEQIKQIIEKIAKDDEELKKILKNIEYNYDEKGLRIDLVENNDNLFFRSGSANLRKEVTNILKVLAVEIGKLPNFIEMEGHTDSRGYSQNTGYSNWELSSDRANAARRVLVNYGLWDGQVQKVTGFADTFLHNPKNPFDKSNRRISILIKNKESSEFYKEYLEEADIPEGDTNE